MSTLLDAVKMADRRRARSGTEGSPVDIPPEGYVAEPEPEIVSAKPNYMIAAIVSFFMFVALIVAVRFIWLSQPSNDTSLESQVDIAYVYSNVMNEEQWSALELITVLSKAQLQGLPNIEFQAQAYYGDVSRDFVILNGERHVVGSSVGSLTVSQITPWGIVLTLESKHYRLPANTNFVHRSDP